MELIHSLDQINDSVSALISSYLSSKDKPLFLFDGHYAIFPGFCDVHVHFREPGFSYKETIKTGCLAAAHGGYTAVCAMPNLNPAPDCLDNLKIEQDIIDRDACIAVYPYGTITKGEQGNELSDMEGLKDYVIAYSDDGRGIQNCCMMKDAMTMASSLHKIIAAHCEDNSCVCGGCIHLGKYALMNGFKGIPSESEFKQVSRDLMLAESTKVSYHVCHVSTKESVEYVRRAKKAGVDVSCETAPHYLVLTDEEIQDEGRFKMNPPLRAKEDQEALIEGILDGTIDLIATDHAPHSAEEKAKGLVGSPFGIVGLETAFAVIYTRLVKTGRLSLERLIEMMSKAPRERFHITSDVGFTVFDLSEEYTIHKEDFLSKGHNTPFDNWKVYGKCMMTVYGGNIVWLDSSIRK